MAQLELSGGNSGEVWFPRFGGIVQVVLEQSLINELPSSASMMLNNWMVLR